MSGPRRPCPHTRPRRHPCLSPPTPSKSPSPYGPSGLPVWCLPRDILSTKDRSPATSAHHLPYELGRDWSGTGGSGVLGGPAPRDYLFCGREGTGTSGGSPRSDPTSGDRPLRVQVEEGDRGETGQTVLASAMGSVGTCEPGGPSTCGNWTTRGTCRPDSG